MNSALAEKELQWAKLHQKMTMRNMIIQCGTELFDPSSFNHMPKLKISIKKLNLETKPVSLRKSYQKFKSSSPQSSLARCIGFVSDSPKSSNCLSMTRSFIKPTAFSLQNPFQNEALKSPLSKRSIAISNKYKRFLKY